MNIESATVSTAESDAEGVMQESFLEELASPYPSDVEGPSDFEFTDEGGSFKAMELQNPVHPVHPPVTSADPTPAAPPKPAPAPTPATSSDKTDQVSELEEFLREVRISDHLEYFQDIGVIYPDELQNCTTEEWQQIREQLGAFPFRRLRAKLGLPNKLTSELEAAPAPVMPPAAPIQQNTPPSGEPEIKWIGFLSHFKDEAGAEARSVKMALEAYLLRTGGLKPGDMEFFIDSDYLHNLERLMQEVKSSENFILLLSKGVLSRPWVLMEIMTALNAKKKVILIDLEHRTKRFDFGSLEVYKNSFNTAPGVTPRVLEELRNHGFSSDDVQIALEEVFLNIAKPLSLNSGSKDVINAQLGDICKVMTLPKKEKPCILM